MDTNKRVTPVKIDVVRSPETSFQKPTFRNNLPEIGFIRLPEVLRYIPVSKSSWWAGIREGVYPPPVKLSERTSGWRVEDIRALIGNLSQQTAANGRIGAQKEV